MSVVRHDACGVDDLAEGSTVSEQEQGNLGVRQFPELLEQPSRFCNSLLSVGVAEVRISYRASEELKVGVAAIDHVRGEQRAVYGAVLSRGRDQLALVGVEL